MRQPSTNLTAPTTRHEHINTHPPEAPCAFVATKDRQPNLISSSIYHCAGRSTLKWLSISLPSSLHQHHSKAIRPSTYIPRNPQRPAISDAARVPTYRPQSPRGGCSQKTGSWGAQDEGFQNGDAGRSSRLVCGTKEAAVCVVAVGEC
jgi:hypothetical protein